MRPSEKGDFGEIAVIKQLMSQGLTVFPQMGHGSRVDMIAMDDGGNLYKVQVKCTTSVKGSACLSLRKQTLDPRYNYRYAQKDADVFALYVVDWDVVVFVSSSEIFVDKEVRSGMYFRLEKPRGVNHLKINMVSEYSKFPINIEAGNGDLLNHDHEQR